jgi:hypothetical protein
MPFVAFLALMMSALSSSMGMEEPPMVPIPPHSATGMARAEVETRIDMPPWIRGTGAVNGPMVKGGNFIWPLNYRDTKTFCKVLRCKVLKLHAGL